MDLHPNVRHEWTADHRLSRRSLLWIHDHADPGDPHPVVTAVAELRASPLSAEVALSLLVAQESLEAVVAERVAEPPGWEAELPVPLPLAGR